MTEPPAETLPSGVPRPDLGALENPPTVAIITGMSGAGRSKAADVLSDLGWYVVDNLPPQMLGGMVMMVAQEQYTRVAAVVDVRGGRFFGDLEAVLDEFQAAGITMTVVFLEADDDVLVRRFESVRRPHPLQGDGTLLDGIRAERRALVELRGRADVVVDTSDLNEHQLAERMVSLLGGRVGPGLVVNVQSFGFKHGVPADADMVADVRFLANPHWDPQLRPLTGLDGSVRDRVLGTERAQEFLDAYEGAVRVVLDGYSAHDKHFVTIAVGCTGGRHRSVAVAEELAARLKRAGYDARARHRDKDLGRYADQTRGPHP